MQTFLTTNNLLLNFQQMDYKRLGKQRVETLQIDNALTNISAGWSNHPAALMWKGYTHALLVYGVCCCNEWISRGYNDTMLEKFLDRIDKRYGDSTPVFPQWLGDERFHSAHRIALLSKDYAWYSQWHWPEDTGERPEIYEYFWPSFSIDYGGQGDGILRKK